MRRNCLTLAFILWLLAFAPPGVHARQGATTPLAPPTSAVAGEVSIQSPKPGQMLQGKAPVVVDTTVEGFKSVELYFGYAHEADGTWFLIYQGLQPVTGAMLVLWDTSTITDGDYTLRMLVTFSDGSQKTALAPDIRVRNYSPVETNTPAPQQPSPTRPAPAAPQLTPAPTGKPVMPTPGPTATKIINPAEIGPQEVLQNVLVGVVGVFGLFALGMLYRAVRKAGRRK